MKKCIAFVLSFAFLIGFSIAHLPDIYASGDAWTNYGIKVDKISPQKEDTEIKLTANVGGDTSKLKYKFVWMKNNWKEWGVIRDFDNSDNVIWKPEATGDYTLYLDVMDTKNRIDTKTLDYKIVQGWKNNEIKVDKISPQKEDTEIKLTANVEGNTSGLKYKFVWMKNNWKEWGVIRDFDNSDNVVWKPEATGDYTLYLDVMDTKGRTDTKTLDYKIVQGWTNNGIKVDKISPQKEDTEIKLTANVEGNTSGLKYKFVWMKNNWKEWGVIRDFDNSDNVVWKPEAAGDYTLYLDVMDTKGRTDTKTLDYKIVKRWTNNGIKVDKISPQKEDTEIKLTANVDGDTSGLKYKFVWMKDNWKEWGVIRDFDNSDNVVWKPENAGDYTLYLDVMDTKGKTDTKTLDYKIVKRWTNNGINLDKDPAQKLGTTFKLTANVGGDQTSLQYKFVWMKDNWRSWGVIKDFNSISSVDWTPSETGSYTLYLDIKDSKDRIETQSTSVRIDPAKGIYGIDVSEWQGYIDWNRVKSSGVEFAMIRCGWSTGIDAPEIDKRFYENVRNAKAAGMPIGVYHYSYARTVDEARQEAEHCLDIIRKCGCTFEYPIVFDIEDEKWTVGATGGDKRIITDIVKAFCNRIEQAGYYASFYANPNWLNNYMYSDELLNRYDLWLAHWGVNEPSRNCGIWQYTSKGSVPGINGNVDLNYAYKDYLSIMRGEHLNGY